MKNIQVSKALLADLRERNIHFQPARLSAEERRSLLEGFHPDHNPSGFSTLPAGPNRGESVPHELCRLLSAHSRVRDLKDLSMLPQDETEVLVIGGGGAGVVAALEAEQCGAAVTLVTKLRTGDSNTVMAEGGIQAAVRDGDSPVQHFLDSYGGGGFSAKRELVSALVNDAPEAIAWLSGLGVSFDRGPEGELLVTAGGGTSRRRMLSARDTTGAEIMRTLKDELLHRPHICIVEHTAAVELLTDGDGRISGALLLHLPTNRLSVLRCRALVLATGGSGQLRIGGFATSNHRSATGDGLVMAYRAGARLCSAGSFQYHPTGVAYPHAMVGSLVTEKVRALGARLVNRYGEVFVHPLEPRDVTTAAVLRECTERDCGIQTRDGVAVWLDTPMIERIHGPGTVEARLPHTLKRFLHFGIDVRREPILVYPTLHYQNGGIDITPEGRSTTVENLFAAGEVTGGIHGNNRLMGNALLDVVVFGRRAGRAAAEAAKGLTPGEGSLSHVCSFEQALADVGIDSAETAPILFPIFDHRT